MSDSYLFDKRRMKRGFIKYGIIFLISFVPLVLFNLYVGTKISANWVVIFLDCVILLVFVTIGSTIANKIFAKQDAKRDARIKERETMAKRKQQILEDSYKKKREEKQASKTKKQNENNKVQESAVSNKSKTTRKKSIKTNENKESSDS